MNSEQRRVGWSFWLWWTGLTIVGGMAGNYLPDLLGLGMLNWPTDTGILLSMLGSGVFALAVSAAQAILLRRLFPKTVGWIVAGTLGRALGMLIGSMTIVIISNKFGLQAGFWSSALYLAVRGAILGAAQWLWLRQLRVRAGWWVLANAIGWTVGSTLADAFVPLGAPLLGDLIDVALAGAVTGAALVWILRQPAPAATKETGSNRLVVGLISIWGISWGASWAVGWSMVRYVMASGYLAVGGKIGGLIAGGIAGLIGGIGTAIVLKLAKPSNGLKIYQLALIALGWAGIVFYDWLGGFVITGLQGNQNQYGIVIASLTSEQLKYGMGGALSGLVGGAITALILFWSVRSLSWKQLGAIVLGWALGFAIGGWVVWTIGFQIALNYAYGPLYGNDPGLSSLILITLVSVLCGAFAGWSGGALTLRQFSIEPSQAGRAPADQNQVGVAIASE